SEILLPRVRDQNDSCESPGVNNRLDRNRPFFMQHRHIIQFGKGVAKVSQLRDLQNCEAWKQALQRKSKDHRYYEIVEGTLECGFEHHYLQLEDTSGNVRAIQPVFFVRQNLVEGVPGKVRSLVDRIRRIFP